MEIKEELLHHVWKYRLLKTPLIDMDDLPVEIVDPGKHNRDSGPDFFNARIRSEGILWAGNVEIHRKASEWYQHGHHLDPAFANVILHVVLDPDCQVRDSRGREIKTIKMEIPPEVRRRYELLMNIPEVIPCRGNLHLVEPGQKSYWMERLVMERLEERAARIRADLELFAGDWQEVMYVHLARAFGQKINADPFEMLARSVSHQSILKYCPDPVSKESLLFGQAGMLGNRSHAKCKAEKDKSGRACSLDASTPSNEAGEDPYYAELCLRYQSLKYKLGLRPLQGFLWKFLRLRPDNFPTIRISQFACLLENYPDLYKQVLADPDPLDFVLNMEIKASEYWKDHYRFHRKSPARGKSMGKGRMTGLFLNAFLPLIFAERQSMGKSIHKAGLTELLTRIPPEDNRIIRMWRSFGIEVPDGLSSQALLQLTKRGGFIT